MLVAITGTPGVGKTAIADELGVIGYIAVSLDELADQEGFIDGEEEGVKLVDVPKLKKFIKTVRSKNNIFLISHYSHLMEPNIVIVLRCNPNELRQRLEKRGWPEKKVRENLEVEAIDFITVEAMENCSRVYELDTTSTEPRFTVENMMKIIENEKFAEKFRPGKIDWSEEVLTWY
jgi:adenylate kinase